MGTGRGRIGVAVAASLAWALTGCGGDGVQDDRSDGGDRPPSETRQQPTTPPASATPAEPEADDDGDRTGSKDGDGNNAPEDKGALDGGRGGADGTGTGTEACFDGRCELTVSEPLSIEVDSRFGVGDLRVTKITDDTVVLRSSGAGTHLSSSVGEGGTGGLNGLGFRVKSLEGGTAVLEFFPRA
ncbi:hypothetical protein [Streptomyces sp. SP17KL33]|uniref:hypothetical protein n=1 Tax=Streptomyces sp. SP17KL33 TaxID=3002534 RepID=UPI002E7864F8|nr:hypothetical protein [Streptomyces sp. SP17KL33]MEE1837760.1 hypothetical protein [Streptomyces sp. SP17KL33]